MSLVNIRKITDDVFVGIWKIDETTDQFFQLYPHLEDIRQKLLEKYSSEERRKEYLAIRALLYDMTHNPNVKIRHNEAGKPLIDGWHVSISHTKGWAALILSRNRTVGIDIEYYSDRVSKVAERFIRKDEEAPDLGSQLIIWSAKETIYKYFSEDDLKYEEMKVFKITDGSCAVVNFKKYISIPVKYEINKDYVLTYAY